MIPRADRLTVIEDRQTTAHNAAGLLVATRRAEMHESQAQLGRVGIVQAVGPRVLSVRPGDRVMFGEFLYPKLTENGVELTVLQEADFCAVLEAA